MKRLMFSVAGVVMASALVGCTTASFKGEDGKPLTTASGAPIYVIDGEVAPVSADPSSGCGISSAKLAEMNKLGKEATMAQRLETARNMNKVEVRISKDDAEKAAKIKGAVLANVSNKISKVENKAALLELVEIVNGRPVVKTAAIEAAAGYKLPAGVVVGVRAMIEKDVAAKLEKEIYPKIADSIVTKVRPAVNKMVAAGEYARARNVIWVSSTLGIQPIDDIVRKELKKDLQEHVNPTEWSAVAEKLQNAYTSAMGSQTYDTGIENVRKIAGSSQVREYAQVIDKKIAAVREELQNLGVSPEDMQPIVEKQSGIIADAAMIKDVCDETYTITEASSEVREIEPRKDPALAAYYAKLDELHQTLLNHNATRENAERITVNLDQELLTLLNMLRKDAVSEEVTTDAKHGLRLGTHSLNLRITALAADLEKKLIDAKNVAEEGAYAARLAADKDSLEKQVRKLVGEGDFEAARELVWNAAATGDGRRDGEMFSFGIKLLRGIINPADWARIEADINSKYESLCESGEFDRLVEFLKSYPRIRQHSVKLDDQLAKVRKEAEALGVSAADAEVAAKTACGMVSEAEAIVDHFDDMIKEAVESKEEVNLADLEKALADYSAKLKLYHATDVNAETIVAKLREMIISQISVSEEAPEVGALSLGTNAVNDRIDNLVAKLLGMIPEKKNAYEVAEEAELESDLEKRVRAAVAEKRFADAREMVRDEKLYGRADLDLKLYALRVGLLDSCVNPAQLDHLLAEIDAKVAELVKAEDFEGLKDYIETYKYVHDEYAEIDKALAGVKTAMTDLGISEAEASNDEKVRFAESIRAMLEKRHESIVLSRDLKPLEQALDTVAKAMFDHMNKHPGKIDSECASARLHILSDLAALDRTITTWELNENLRLRLQKELTTVEEGLEKQRIRREEQAYLELIALIDAEVSFDSQIAIAEEAISRQLGIACDHATFKVNALLGEYARMFRLLKKQTVLTPDQATSILLGAAYLGQLQVVDYSLKLGASINGVSKKDPRGRSALALAIDAGNSGLVKTLVGAGASVDAKDADGNAIVHYAAKSGNLAVLKAIVAKTGVEVTNNNGCTPLMIAVSRNQPAIVDAVIAAASEGSRKSFVNAKNKAGDTAFDVAAKCGSRDVLDSLANAGAVYGPNDLAIACENDHVAIAQWLVNQGLDVNANGVMNKACPITRTGRYLAAEGGVDVGHVCDACKPPAQK